MKNFKQVFHILSYLQYPILLLALFYAVKPYLKGFDYLVEHIGMLPKDLNYLLIFLGLGISFSTLQDTSKTSLSFEKKIWENPKKGKIVLVFLSVLTLLTISFGIFAYFISDDKTLKELSFGSIVLGIGLIGLLKTAVEVHDSHKIDEMI